MGGKNKPQIKFYKDAVPNILSGRKTVEPRPRSPKWIATIADSKLVDLTYGPRIGVPKIFASGLQTIWQKAIPLFGFILN